MENALVAMAACDHKAASAPRASPPQASASGHIGLATGSKLSPQAIEAEQVFGGDARHLGRTVNLRHPAGARAVAHRRFHDAQLRSHGAGQELPPKALF